MKGYGEYYVKRFYYYKKLIWEVFDIFRKIFLRITNTIGLIPIPMQTKKITNPTTKPGSDGMCGGKFDIFHQINLRHPRLKTFGENKIDK